jgi:adenylate cyclase
MMNEAQLSARQPLANPSAWDLYLRGLWHFNRITEDQRADALACFEQAIALDPALADAHVGVARVLHSGVVYGLETDRAAVLTRALAAARRAIDLDHRNAYAWFILAMARATGGDAETAMAAARRSVELNPSLAWGHFAVAVSGLYLGKHAVALEAIDLALRLSPHEPKRFAWLATRASALYLLRQYHDAIDAAQQSRALRPFATASRVMAASYGQLGLVREAAAALCSLRELGTELTIEAAVRPFLEMADRAHYAEGLRRAGMPSEAMTGEAGSDNR